MLVPGGWAVRAVAVALALSAAIAGCDSSSSPEDVASTRDLLETTAAGQPTTTPAILRDVRRRVIINLHVDAWAKLRTAQARVAGLLGTDLQLVRRYATLPAVAGWITPRGAALAAASSDVLSVQADAPSEAHLAQSVPLLGGDTVRNVLNITGAGVRVAVLDTGIATTHPDLADSLVAQHCFTQSACPPGNTSEGTSAEDDNGHGTNVSGIITSNGTIAPIGFAPSADIVAIKVLAADGSGLLSDWLAGLDWIIDNQATLNVRVVNMSFGTDTIYAGNCDGVFPTVTSAVAQLNALGISVFASSGNNGSSTSIGSPACHTGVIAVGATYDASFGQLAWPTCVDATTNTNTIACFTNSNAQLDVLAPGAIITSTGLSNGTSNYSGSSQAAPTAAAIAALIAQCNPSMTPAQIESTLKATGTTLTDAKNGRSFPRITALGAVSSACPQCTGQPDGAACTDGNECTAGDTCQSATCTAGALQTCSGHGICNTSTGACACAAAYAGAACQYSDSTTCNGHGAAQANGSCNCATGFTGTSCNQCASNYYAYPTCTFCLASSCAAPDACHNAATCDAAGQCAFLPKANGSACNDGDACTLTDTCQTGTCTGTSPVICTAQDQCHNPGTCNSATGACSNPNRTDGSACNDGNACTLTDTCQTGTCTGTSPVICTAQDQCHNPGTCNSASGACSNPSRPDGSACNDGNACTQTDSCQSGTCTGATPVVCAAQDQCHNPGTCNSASGACSNPNRPDGSACNDGNACTQTDSCQSGTCTGATPVVCASLDQCHSAGTCNSATGVCSNPNRSDGSACDDSNACTQTDSCQVGTCIGASPVVCTTQDQCHTAGTRNSTTGVCSNPIKADGSACTDGDPLSINDGCSAGVCIGNNLCLGIVCTTQDQCHTAGACNLTTGVCSNPMKADGAACSDGNACSQGDTCQAGTCSGANPVVCVPLDQCHTAGACSAATGVCSNPAKADGSICDDGNASTTGDVCAGGACTGFHPPADAAADADVEAPDATTCNGHGTAQPNGSCDCASGIAGAVCDRCAPSYYGYPTCTFCVASSCAPPDACHDVAACNAAGECAYSLKSNGSECDDGNACTQLDTCQAGSCAGANPTICAPLDQCHEAGACNPATGVCSNPAKADGAICSEGTCKQGTCTASVDASTGVIANASGISDPTSEGQGCGCKVAGHGSDGLAWIAALTLGLVVARRQTRSP